MMLCRLFRFLLLFGLTTASHWHHFAETFTERCLFTLGGNTVDLCPIARAPQRITEYRDPAQSHSEGTKLLLVVGREETDLQYSSRKCFSETWICMKASFDGSHEPQRPVPITASFAGEGTQVWDKDLRALSIPHPSAVKEAHIVFICDGQAHSQLSPTFIGEGDGVLLFFWRTPYACDQTISSHGYTVTEEEANPSEDGDEKPDDEQELIQRPISGSHFRSTTTIILLSLSGVMVLGYLFYSQPPIVRQLVSTVSSHVKPMRFRVGESRLIRWAQEDMEFLEGEVDFMVNGDMDEEQIPLKPSPRLSRPFTNYGTTK